MTCEHVTLPGGGRAIVCSSRRRARCACGRPAPLLCDWKVPGKRSGACDKPICAGCSTKPAPDKDLCPEHAQAYQQWKDERMTPWQWWWGHDDGFDTCEVYICYFPTRDAAIAAALHETQPGDRFHVIEARSSESLKHDQADVIPFLRTRNHEILTNGPQAAST
ncbi:hypothetical protein [Rhizorhabdus wittichii]|uniref:hypothetical protein n=1 Tax=Rhizorhabdus wittichii TaxID=160791 RepID=UPI0002FAAA91|nr:hypothetical protein [Rhizorhabdus wittichii]